MYQYSYSFFKFLSAIPLHRHTTHFYAFISGGYLSWLKFLAIMDKDTVNICVCFWVDRSFPFFWVLRSRIAGSSGKYVFDVKGTVFQVAIPFLHSYQQCVTVLAVLHSYQHLELMWVFLGFFVFFIFLSITIGVWNSLILDLISISQMTNAVEHLLMSLVAIHITLVKCLLKSFKYCIC